MSLNNPAILVTAEIGQSLVNEMINAGIKADIIPFIRTQPLQNDRVQKLVGDLSKARVTVVFTSSNAVGAISKYLQNKNPDWKIYCIGNATRSLIEKTFEKDSIAATANDAGALAQQIIAGKNLIDKIYFFCGDKRRDELPALLKQNNIIVYEIEVYTTTILNHQIERDYDAILFFSPSAVNGFFANNLLNEKTVLFAIGSTTANEIKKFTGNRIIVSERSGKKDLVEKMMAFFEN